MDFEKRISDYGMTPEQYEASFAEITAKVQETQIKIGLKLLINTLFHFLAILFGTLVAMYMAAYS